jgi:hypothetical protein
VNVGDFDPAFMDAQSVGLDVETSFYVLFLDTDMCTKLTGKHLRAAYRALHPERNEEE